MVFKKPAAPIGERVNDEKAFLKCILARHEELGLDETQFNSLSRMYWDRSKGSSPGDAIAAVAEILSPKQFSTGVASMIAQRPAATHDAVALDATVETLVGEVLEKRTKDKQLVELQLATQVAERVMGWAKLFAFFVAAPVALGLVLLGAVGFSKFEDVQKASSAVDTKIVEAQTKIDAGLNKVAQVLDLASRNVARTEAQLATIQSTLADQTTKVATLNDTVTNLGRESAVRARHRK
jgi:hypothetical protein